MPFFLEGEKKRERESNGDKKRHRVPFHQTFAKLPSLTKFGAEHYKTKKDDMKLTISLDILIESI